MDSRTDTQRPKSVEANRGKDEMNLVENCIFSPTQRVDKKTKSIVFDDSVRRGGVEVPRRLTVAFSAEYGRPTARDDLLMLALMKLTRDAGYFTDGPSAPEVSPKIYFTRYQLLDILNWPDEGNNYKRINDGFNRIRGTHLDWENCYWDNREKDWVTRKFSIIDDVELLERGRYDRIRERSGEQRPRSWFKWSDVMFESFQAGYIKSLDLEALHQIENFVGKRLYRWLDKRFNNKGQKLPLEIPLLELSGQKLGLSTKHPSHVIRILEPAIDELVTLGHLYRDSSRVSEKNGTPIIRFRPGRGKSKSTTTQVRQPVEQKPQSTNPLASELVKRGVTAGNKKPTCAASLVEAYPPEKIRRSISYFDYLNAIAKTERDHKKVGWLIQSITSEGAEGFDGFVPDDFQCPEEAKKRSEQRRARERAEQEARFRKQKEEAQLNREQAERILTYRNSFTPEEQIQLEDQALEKMGQGPGSMYYDGIQRHRSTGKMSPFVTQLWKDRIMPRCHFDAISEDQRTTVQASLPGM